MQQPVREPLAILGGVPTGSIPDRPWPLPTGGELQALRSVLASSNWSIDGPFQTEVEVTFAEYHTAAYALCVANGTIALQLALEALDIGVGDEVLVPGLTWQATASAVLEVNATPVLIDIDESSYCIDTKRAEAAITARTKAIIVVHLYSGFANMSAVNNLAQRHGLRVIEDCAHAHGESWADRGAGSIGDIGCFSFQQAKTLTCGEGGLVTTSQRDLYDRLYSLRNCGRRRNANGSLEWEPIQSGNHRMSEFQAAVLACQLRRLSCEADQRDAACRYLDESLACIDGVQPLRVPTEMTRRNPYRYVVRFDPQEWSGLRVEAFRGALETEVTGLKLAPTYEPLNECELYKPDTKRRHRLGPSYEEAVKPSRFELPVSQRAYREEGSVIPHTVLLNSIRELQAIPRAIEKLKANQNDLVRWAASRQPERTSSSIDIRGT